MIGIYGIKNKVNGKIYIGQSVNIDRRLKEHLRDLRKNKHYNIHLQRSFNKYLESSFKLLTLEECDEESLALREQFWLNNKGKDSVFNYIFNIQYRNGENNPFYGRKHTDESKAKMSAWKVENYIGTNNPNYGKKASKNTLIKMSEGRSTKLKKDDVLQIVHFLKKGTPHKEIAQKFNVGRTVITRISNGSRWTNVTGGPVIPVQYENGKRKQSIYHLTNRSK